MSPKETLLWLSLFLLVSFPIPSASVNDELTVYEVLEEYDFPVGILPKGALGYELDNSTDLELEWHRSEGALFLAEHCQGDS